MKALKPSHREHKRYLLISGKDASKENIGEAILKFVGILGYAKASPDFIKLDKIKLEKFKGKVVLAVNRSEIDKIRAALLMSGLALRVEKVSGIIGKI